MQNIPQFGQALAISKDRPSAYAVIMNNDGKLLAVKVKNRYHLPGGGIDANENAETAVRREIVEETGYHVDQLTYLGRANQFLVTQDLGPLNKLGQYYVGVCTDVQKEGSGEEDHEVCWIDPQEFLDSTAHEFHRWAVTQMLRR